MSEASLSETEIPPPANDAQTVAPRADHLLVANMVEPGARVLDIGCGDGELLSLLKTTRGADARGMELSQAGVNICVAKGLSVIQGDADTDLDGYPDRGFDYVILSQTLQATRRPDAVIDQITRIGRRAIVSFPNFGHWRVRLSLLAGGRMPVTRNLDEPWYLTPNIHLCTIKDFVDLCEARSIRIEKALGVVGGEVARPFSGRGTFANLLAEEAVVLLSR